MRVSHWRHLPLKKEWIQVLVVVVLIIVIVVAAGDYGYNFYENYQHQKQVLAQIDSTGNNVQDLVAKVGKLIILPTSEVPTVATVSDKSKLTGQPFFANAENGDKVLIYTQAKKAVLYRPSTNQIVEVGPVTVPQQPMKTNQQASNSAQITPSVTPVEETAKVALYNGTMVVGLTKVAKQDLMDKFSNIEITDRVNATTQDYDKTIVVDVTGKASKTAKDIASDLKATVAPLPKGEKTLPDDDIIVILGSDFAK